MKMCILVILTVFAGIAELRAQLSATGADPSADVIDHTRFDSLWHEAVVLGKLRADYVQCEAYESYRKLLATAYPSAALPPARTAFWINAYLACLMEQMHRRTGYRSTVWDSTWLSRDSFLIAGRPLTLESMINEAIISAGSVRVVGCLPSGSSLGAPFPSHVAFTKTVRRIMRDQMRRICRSERYVLYDPFGNVLQLSRFFEPIRDRMVAEAGSEAQWVLPFVSDAVAAQIALGAAGIRVVVLDRIETWRKARPR